MPDTRDSQSRQDALDISRSFIVQAPAGSGKTGLLIQRYLALLGCADEPEEILAITFTRKAAGEMRERILDALEATRDPAQDLSGHEGKTLRLAQTAMARSEALDWRLTDSPSRLQVMTIDAFNASLARRLPIRSGSGGAVRVSDDPVTLYTEAIRRTLCSADRNIKVREDADRLLRHLDNDFPQAEAMLVSLLARRDHWMPHVIGHRTLDEESRRAKLESSIRRQVDLELAAVHSRLTRVAASDLAELAAYAAATLEEEGVDSVIRGCAGLVDLPPPSSDSLRAWRGIAELLLTRGGDWRKTVTKTCGFPTTDKARKDRMICLLDDLRDRDDLRRKLRDVRMLPDPEYSASQWRILGALVTVLPHALAELELVFRASGETDYVAISQAAHAGLGQPGEPGDLALALDYRLRHILVDEFQDTSRSQNALLAKLMGGWVEGDGRTLFCVGDPMQSIYGFREADVGLYLNARRHGIGDTVLASLRLTANFRSDGPLVKWVNQIFADVLPLHEDPRSGAVSFEASEPVLPLKIDGPVIIRSVVDDDGDKEAGLVVDCVANIRREDPEATVAILVRARTHLDKIAPQLRRADVRFQAVEIERLDSSPVVQDLMSLTRALCHAADRVAWLALLRAPFCGLELVDLLRLESLGDRTLWDAICDRDRVLDLSEDARRRLERVAPVLAAALDERGRRSLSRLVEGTWVALGGPAVVDATAFEDARSYLGLLDSLDVGCDLEDVAALENKLDSLYAAPDVAAGPQVQLLTIHKAKGLQFDYVIMPGLQRVVSAGQQNLLHWLEPLSDGNRVDLLLAAAGEKGADKDPLQGWLAHMERKRERLELGRLLYVAVTRARRQLYLLSSLTTAQAEDDNRPKQGSFLSLLWPRLAGEFRSNVAGEDPVLEGEGVRRGPPEYRRVAADWCPASAPGPVVFDRKSADAASPGEGIEFDWAGRRRRAVGTVVHRLLERIAADGPESWGRSRLDDQVPAIRHLLREAGAPTDGHDEAGGEVVEAVANALQDDRGRWILSHEHSEAETELALTGVIDDKTFHAVLDRTFVDRDGTRWIVDYKTGIHAGGALEQFLDEEQQRYKPQLEGYARLMQCLEPTVPIKVALYYPVHKAWRQWQPDLDSVPPVNGRSGSSE